LLKVACSGPGVSRTRNLGYESDTLGYHYTSVATNTWKCAKMLKCARPVAGQFLSRSAVLERDIGIKRHESPSHASIESKLMIKGSYIFTVRGL